MGKKLVFWGVIVLVIFLVLYRQDQALTIVNGVWGGLMDFIDGVGSFSENAG